MYNVNLVVSVLSVCHFCYLQGYTIAIYYIVQTPWNNVYAYIWFGFANLEVLSENNSAFRNRKKFFQSFYLTLHLIHSGINIPNKILCLAASFKLNSKSDRLFVHCSYEAKLFITNQLQMQGKFSLIFLLLMILFRLIACCVFFCKQYYTAFSFLLFF